MNMLSLDGFVKNEIGMYLPGKSTLSGLYLPNKSIIEPSEFDKVCYGQTTLYVGESTKNYSLELPKIGYSNGIIFL